MSSWLKITHMVAKPATPDLLEVGVIWMMTIDTKCAFYRATASFLDPLCPPGTAGRRRDIPLPAAARISASACLFSTNAHHVTRGIIPMDWAQRVRGNYITLNAYSHFRRILHPKCMQFRRKVHPKRIAHSLHCE